MAVAWCLTEKSKGLSQAERTLMAGEHAVEGSLQAIGWNGVVCMEMNVLIVGVNAGVRSTATLHLQVGLFQDEMEFLAENALNRGNLGLDLPPIKRGPNIRDS